MLIHFNSVGLRSFLFGGVRAAEPYTCQITWIPQCSQAVSSIQIGWFHQNVGGIEAAFYAIYRDDVPIAVVQTFVNGAYNPLYNSTEESFRFDDFGVTAGQNYEYYIMVYAGGISYPSKPNIAQAGDCGPIVDRFCNGSFSRNTITWNNTVNIWNSDPLSPGYQSYSIPLSYKIKRTGWPEWPGPKEAASPYDDHTAYENLSYNYQIEFYKPAVTDPIQTSSSTHITSLNCSLINPFTATTACNGAPPGDTFAKNTVSWINAADPPGAVFTYKLDRSTHGQDNWTPINDSATTGINDWQVLQGTIYDYRIILKQGETELQTIITILDDPSTTEVSDPTKTCSPKTAKNDCGSPSSSFRRNLLEWTTASLPGGTASVKIKRNDWSESRSPPAVGSYPDFNVNSDDYKSYTYDLELYNGATLLQTKSGILIPTTNTPTCGSFTATTACNGTGSGDTFAKNTVGWTAVSGTGFTYQLDRGGGSVSFGSITNPSNPYPDWKVGQGDTYTYTLTLKKDGTDIQTITTTMGNPTATCRPIADPTCSGSFKMNKISWTTVSGYLHKIQRDTETPVDVSTTPYNDLKINSSAESHKYRFLLCKSGAPNCSGDNLIQTSSDAIKTGTPDVTEIINTESCFSSFTAVPEACTGAFADNKVSWTNATPPPSIAFNYTIKRRINGAQNWSDPPIATNAPTGYPDWQVSQGTAYDYQVILLQGATELQSISTTLNDPATPATTSDPTKTCSPTVQTVCNGTAAYEEDISWQAAIISGGSTSYKITRTPNDHNVFPVDAGSGVTHKDLDVGLGGGYTYAVELYYTSSVPGSSAILYQTSQSASDTVGVGDDPVCSILNVVPACAWSVDKNADGDLEDLGLGDINGVSSFSQNIIEGLPAASGSNYLFKISKKLNVGNSWETVYGPSATLSSTYNDFNLTGGTYDYRLDICSSTDATCGATTSLQAIEANGVTTKPCGDATGSSSCTGAFAENEMEWLAPDDGRLFYKIERKLTSEGDEKWVAVSSDFLDRSQGSYFDWSGAQGSAYNYRIALYDPNYSPNLTTAAQYVLVDSSPTPYAISTASGCAPTPTPDCTQPFAFNKIGWNKITAKDYKRVENVKYYSTAGDGHVYGKGDWNTAHSTGAGAESTSSDNGYALSGYRVDVINKYFIYRQFVPIDTRSLAGNPISAKLNIYVHTKYNDANDLNSYISVLGPTAQGTPPLTANDYNAWGSPLIEYSKLNLSGTDITASQYNPFVFNQSGLNAITQGAYTKIGLREGHDLNNTSNGIPVINLPKWSGIRLYNFEDPGVSRDPNLEITYAPASPAPYSDNEIIYELRRKGKGESLDLNPDDPYNWGTSVGTITNPTDQAITNLDLSDYGIDQIKTYYYRVVLKIDGEAKQISDKREVGPHVCAGPDATSACWGDQTKAALAANKIDWEAIPAAGAYAGSIIKYKVQRLNKTENPTDADWDNPNLTYTSPEITDLITRNDFETDRGNQNYYRLKAYKTVGATTTLLQTSNPSDSNPANNSPNIVYDPLPTISTCKPRAENSCQNSLSVNTVSWEAPGNALESGYSYNIKRTNPNGGTTSFTNVGNPYPDYQISINNQDEYYKYQVVLVRTTERQTSDESQAHADSCPAGTVTSVDSVCKNSSNPGGAFANNTVTTPDVNLKYKVERADKKPDIDCSANADDDYAVKSELLGQKATWTDVNVTQGASYCYRLAVYDLLGSLLYKTNPELNPTDTCYPLVTQYCDVLIKYNKVKWDKIEGYDYTVIRNGVETSLLPTVDGSTVSVKDYNISATPDVANTPNYQIKFEKTGNTTQFSGIAGPPISATCVGEPNATSACVNDDDTDGAFARNTITAPSTLGLNYGLERSTDNITFTPNFTSQRVFLAPGGIWTDDNISQGTNYYYRFGLYYSSSCSGTSLTCTDPPEQYTSSKQVSKTCKPKVTQSCDGNLIKYNKIEWDSITNYPYYEVIRKIGVVETSLTSNKISVNFLTDYNIVSPSDYSYAIKFYKLLSDTIPVQTSGWQIPTLSVCIVLPPVVGSICKNSPPGDAFANNTVSTPDLTGTTGTFYFKVEKPTDDDHDANCDEHTGWVSQQAQADFLSENQNPAWSDASVDQGTSYCYRLAVYNADKQWLQNTNSVSKAAGPCLPDGGSYCDGIKNYNKVEWDAITDYTYNVKRTDSDGISNPQTFLNVPSPYKDYTVTPTISYNYQVEFWKDGTSQTSGVKTIQTSAACFTFSVDKLCVGQFNTNKVSWSSGNPALDSSYTFTIRRADGDADLNDPANWADKFLSLSSTGEWLDLDNINDDKGYYYQIAVSKIGVATQYTNHTDLIKNTETCSNLTVTPACSNGGASSFSVNSITWNSFSISSPYSWYIKRTNPVGSTPSETLITPSASPYDDFNLVQGGDYSYSFVLKKGVEVLATSEPPIPATANTCTVPTVSSSCPGSLKDTNGDGQPEPNTGAFAQNLVSWAKASGSTLKYQIERKLPSEGDNAWTAVSPSINVNEQSYSDWKVEQIINGEPGKYNYRIALYDTNSSQNPAQTVSAVLDGTQTAPIYDIPTSTCIPDVQGLCSGSFIKNNVAWSDQLPSQVIDGYLFSSSKPIAISNPAAATLANFQVKLDLTNANAGDIFEKTKPDGSDIRFLDSSGSKLNYWVEGSWDKDGQKAAIWIKVPTIPIAGTTIYMYYGNANAPSASSGDATFDFFDDFTELNASTSVDLAKKWRASHPGQYQTIENGRLKVTGGLGASGDWGGSGMYSQKTFARGDWIVEADFQTYGGSYSMWGVDKASPANYSYNQYPYNIYPNINNLYIFEYATSYTPTDITTFTPGQLYKFRIKVNSGSGAKYELSVDDGNTWQFVRTTTSDSTSLLRIGYAGYDRAFYIDNWLIRKSASDSNNNPTANVGASVGATGFSYKVQRDSGPAFSGADFTTEDVGSGTNYADFNNVSGKKWYYRVQLKDGSGNLLIQDSWYKDQESNYGLCPDTFKVTPFCSSDVANAAFAKNTVDWTPADAPSGEAFSYQLIGAEADPVDNPNHSYDDWSVTQDTTQTYTIKLLNGGTEYQTRTLSETTKKCHPTAEPLCGGSFKRNEIAWDISGIPSVYTYKLQRGDDDQHLITVSNGSYHDFKIETEKGTEYILFLYKDQDLVQASSLAIEKGITPETTTIVNNKTCEAFAVSSGCQGAFAKNVASWKQVPNGETLTYKIGRANEEEILDVNNETQTKTTAIDRGAGSWVDYLIDPTIESGYGYQIILYNGSEVLQSVVANNGVEGGFVLTNQTCELTVTPGCTGEGNNGLPQIDISWEPNVPEDTFQYYKDFPGAFPNYQVQRRSGSSQWIPLANLGSAQNSFPDLNITSGLTYEYKVLLSTNLIQVQESRTNSGMASTCTSNLEINPTCDDETTAPADDGSAFAKNVVTWPKIEVEGIHYKVERADCQQDPTCSGASYTARTIDIGNPDTATVSWSDFEITPGDWYWYQVAVYREDTLDPVSYFTVSGSTQASSSCQPKVTPACDVYFPELPVQWNKLTTDLFSQDATLTNGLWYRLERKTNTGDGSWKTVLETKNNTFTYINEDIIETPANPPIVYGNDTNPIKFRDFYIDTTITPPTTYYYKLSLYRKDPQGPGGESEPTPIQTSSWDQNGYTHSTIYSNGCPQPDFNWNTINSYCAGPQPFFVPSWVSPSGYLNYFEFYRKVDEGDFSQYRSCDPDVTVQTGSTINDVNGTKNYRQCWDTGILTFHWYTYKLKAFYNNGFFAQGGNYILKLEIISDPPKEGNLCFGCGITPCEPKLEQGCYQLPPPYITTDSPSYINIAIAPPSFCSDPLIYTVTTYKVQKTEAINPQDSDWFYVENDSCTITPDEYSSQICYIDGETKICCTDDDAKEDEDYKYRVEYTINRPPGYFIISQISGNYLTKICPSDIQPVSACANTSIEFRDQKAHTAGITSFLWNFGNYLLGASATAETAPLCVINEISNDVVCTANTNQAMGISYAYPGAKPVNLTLTGASGHTANTQKDVTIDDAPVIESFTSDTGTVNTGGRVTFSWRVKVANPNTVSLVLSYPDGTTVDAKNYSTVSDAGFGYQYIDGSYTTNSLTQGGGFSLTAINTQTPSCGQDEKIIAIAVNAPPSIKGDVYAQSGINNLTIIGPAVVAAGQNITLNTINSVSPYWQINSYNPVNFILWSNAKTKMTATINRLKYERKKTLTANAIDGSFPLNPNDKPEGQVWHHIGDLNINTGTGFTGRGTIIVENGNVNINSGFAVSGGALGIIVKEGNINIASGVNSLKGSFYAATDNSTSGKGQINFNNPSNAGTKFTGLFVADNIILNTNTILSLTIEYDPGAVNNPPPGFGQLLRTKFREIAP